MKRFVRSAQPVFCSLKGNEEEEEKERKKKTADDAQRQSKISSANVMEVTRSREFYTRGGVLLLALHRPVQLSANHHFINHHHGAS